MTTLLRNLQRILVFVLQTEPNRQLYALLYLLLYTVIINVAINALYTRWQPGWWSTLTVTVALLVLPVLVLSAVEHRRRRDGYLIHYGQLPQPQAGLILPLSLFFAPADTHTDDNRPPATRAAWRQAEIIAAVNDPLTDWAYLRQRFEQSNMGPALAAIRHHAGNGKLQHIWLLTTLDEKNEFDNVIQPGSLHFAPSFAQILNDARGYAMALQIHYENPLLQVSSTDLMAAHDAVTHIFNVEAGRYGLRPTELIADITNGRLPTSIGMALACATQSRPMQYTTTVEDPAATTFRKNARPQEIAIDPKVLLRYAIDALKRQ